jgi:glycosyltransferase involved in cell wall biosynthesis
VSAERSIDVLHLLWSGAIGGVERVVEALVGHDPGHRALFLDGAGPIGDALVAAGRAERLGMRGGWELAKLPRLASALRRRSPRVVHVHTHALVPLAAARAALPGASWVYHEHSPRVLRRDRKFTVLYRMLRAARARFVAPSAAVGRAMRRQLGAAIPIAVVPNPCAVAPLQAPAPPLGPSPVIGVVARLEPQKRVDLLLETIAALRRGGTECRGLVVGGGSLDGALRRRRAELGLDGIIELAGEQLDLLRWLDRMDLFLATPAAEPFGVAAVEAMARRVPVVAMPCPGGLDELAARGGLLLPDRRIETAAAAVARLLTDEAARDELRRRGDRVAAESATAAVAERLRSVYDAETGARPVACC